MDGVPLNLPRCWKTRLYPGWCFSMCLPPPSPCEIRPAHRFPGNVCNSSPCKLFLQWWGQAKTSVPRVSSAHPSCHHPAVVPENVTGLVPILFVSSSFCVNSRPRQGQDVTNTSCGAPGSEGINCWKLGEKSGVWSRGVSDKMEIRVCMGSSLGASCAEGPPRSCSFGKRSPGCPGPGFHGMVRTAAPPQQSLGGLEPWVIREPLVFQV